MLIAVSGGRTYSDRLSMFRALNHAVRTLRAKMGQSEPIRLIHGGAKGADTLAHEWAHFWVRVKNEEIDVIIAEANWSAYGKYAGPARNAEMAEGKLVDSNGHRLGQPDLWVFAPGGLGTADAHSKAVAAKIPRLYINPEEHAIPMGWTPGATVIKSVGEV